MVRCRAKAEPTYITAYNSVRFRKWHEDLREVSLISIFDPSLFAGSYAADGGWGVEKVEKTPRDR